VGCTGKAKFQLWWLAVLIPRNVIWLSRDLHEATAWHPPSRVQFRCSTMICTYMCYHLRWAGCTPIGIVGLSGVILPRVCWPLRLYLSKHFPSLTIAQA
jgi:hypothetical protein